MPPLPRKWSVGRFIIDMRGIDTITTYYYYDYRYHYYIITSIISQVIVARTLSCLLPSPGGAAGLPRALRATEVRLGAGRGEAQAPPGGAAGGSCGVMTCYILCVI